MITKLRQRHEADGFTLIELLVVILIIGILAAIAIPVFLNQRRRAYDAAAKNDLRNLSGFEEIYLTDALTYGTIAEIQLKEPQLNLSQGVTLTVVKYDTGKAYCLSAHHTASDSTWYWDSQAGGMQPKGSTGCPVTTTGVAGDSKTG